MWTHVTIASEGRTTVFEDEDRMRAGVRAIARVLGERLLLFCVVDDHVHVVLGTESGTAGRAGADVGRALRALGAGPFQAVHVRPVDGRRHLETLVTYLVRQPAHHGIAVHAARWEGSCALDLLGARVLPGFDRTAITRALPRLDVDAAVRTALDVPEDVVRPVLSSAIRNGGASALWDAVRGAACVGKERTNEPHQVLMRATFAVLADRAGIAATEGRRVANISKAAWSRDHTRTELTTGPLAWAAVRRWRLDREVPHRPTRVPEVGTRRPVR